MFLKHRLTFCLFLLRGLIFLLIGCVNSILRPILGALVLSYLITLVIYVIYESHAPAMFQLGS